MNILITAIGSFSADYVISSLKRNNHNVIGCDIYPPEWHAVSNDCTTVYQVPLATKEQKYIDTLIYICSKENIDLIFPLTDVEVDVLNRHRSCFAERGVQVCLQSESTLRVARNKHILSCVFQNEACVQVPKFTLIADADSNFPFPAIAKPVDGRSSEGLCDIPSYADLQRLKLNPDYILQQKLTGSIFTVDYVRQASSSKDVIVPREELLRTKNGAGTTVRITPDPVLIRTASYIGNKLQINGCINMEFIYNSGKYYLIDINPRFSAGVAFSAVAGYDMVAAHLACFTSGTIAEAPDLKKIIITKRYREEIITYTK